MGWTVYVKLSRARGALTGGERDRLVAFVAEHNREPWAVEQFDLLLPPVRRRADALAYGAIKLARDLEHPDLDRLLDVLTALRGVIAGAVCEVEDDDRVVAWAEGGYTLDLGPQPSFEAPDTTGWQRARSLVGGRRRVAPAPAAVQTPLDAAIALLTTFPRNGYRSDGAEKRAAAVIEQVAGAPAIREPLLALWRRTPAPHGAMASLRWLVKPLLTTPWFRDELLASIARAGQAGEGHRAYVAADLLLTTRPADRAALRAVLAVLRRHRLDPGSFASDPPDDDERDEPVVQRLMWLPHLWNDELSPPERDAAVAGCVLALASPGSTGFVPRAIMKLGGAAMLPLLARIPIDHPHALGGAHQVTSVAQRDPAAFDAAAALCLRHVFHPFMKVRLEIARALRVLRGPQADPLLDRAVELARREDLETRVSSLELLDGRPDVVDPALADAVARDVPLADPLEDLVARDRWHRSQGVTRYLRRHVRDGAPLLPLLLTAELNAHLPAYERATSLSWYRCAALPRELQRRAATAERAAFIRAHATPADHAALPPLLRDVETMGAAAVAARLAAPMPPVIDLSAAERAAFEAAEQAWLGEGSVRGRGPDDRGR